MRPSRRHWLAEVFGIWVLFCTGVAQALELLDVPNVELQSPGEVSVTLRDPATRVLYVGGAFARMNGKTVSNLARFNPDGTLDESWSPNPDGSVNALALDGTGNLYVGGSFSSLGGAARRNLAKVSTDNGSVDANWAPDPDGSVKQLLLDGAGSLYVGGRFLNIGGLPRTNLARLSTAASGPVDPDWTPGPSGSNSGVNALVLAGEWLYVGGEFSGIGGTFLNNLARVTVSGSGAADPLWAPNPSGTTPAAVRALALDGDMLYVGGYFKFIQGEPHDNLARVPMTGNGGADRGWNPTVDLGGVYALALDGRGKLYAGGIFFRNLARFSTFASGAPDSDWTPNADARVLALVPDGSDGVYVAGGFSAVGGKVHFGLARITAAGDADPAINAAAGAFSPEVFALARQSDGHLLIGGRFFVVSDGTVLTNLVRVNPDNTIDVGWNPNPDSSVLTLATDATRFVYVGGEFSHIKGEPRSGLAKLPLDGNGAAAANWLPATAIMTRALALDGDGNLFVGGWGPETLVKLSTETGFADPSWRPNPEGSVLSLALDGLGNLYLGGVFTSVGGRPIERLARVSISGEGAPDVSWTPNPDGEILAVALDGNGSVYVGGNFDLIAGQPRHNLARLSTANGAADPAWIPDPDGDVYTISLKGTDQAYVGGGFQNISHQWVRGAAALRVSDASVAVDSSFHLSDGGTVHALMFDPLGSMYAGGTFMERFGSTVFRAGVIGLTEHHITLSAFGSRYGEPLTLHPLFDPPIQDPGITIGTVTIYGDSIPVPGCVDIPMNMFTLCAVTGLAVGHHEFVVQFKGSGALDGLVMSSRPPSIVSVLKADTSSTLGAAESSGYSDAVPVTFTVTPVAPGAGTPTGTVTVNYAESATGTPSGVLCSTEVAAGSCGGTLPQAGSYTLTVSYGGDGNFNASVSPGRAHNVAKLNQVITFGPAPSLKVGSSATLSASGGGSGNPVTFSSQTSGVCTVSGSTVTGIAAGTCTVAADQAGAINHNPAPTAMQSFGVAEQQFALAVTRTGTGSGTISSTPAGIDCGTTCTGSFTKGGNVVLNATAAAGSQFAGWSGACSGNGGCTVAMTADRSVTASFTASYTLTVSRTGRGTVTSSPAGINCGTNCSSSFASGQSVTLAATPASGYRFLGWGGACSGTGNCTVNMTQARSVSAGFKPLNATKGDLNADGKADILWHSASLGGTDGWLMNGLTRTAVARLFTNTAWAPAASGDLDGDGTTDILWHNAATGKTDLWFMNGLAKTSAVTLLTSIGTKPLLAADLNGDGREDIIWYNPSTGRTDAWLMQGQSYIGSATLYTSTQWQITAAGDLDADGKADLIWYNTATGEARVWLMDGLAQRTNTALFTSTAWKPVATGDLNGDGKADILWHNASIGGTDAWLMNGTTRTGAARLLTLAGWAPVGTGDLNGDSKADILWHNATTGQTDAWLMDGFTRTASAVLLKNTAWAPLGR